MAALLRKAVVVTALVLGGNVLLFQITRWLFNTYRIDALGFEIGYAATALLPAFVAWAVLGLSGDRGAGWPFLCLPGVLLWTARPYRGSEGWTPGWVFDDLIAYGGLIVRNFDLAPPDAFAAINAAVLILLVSAGAIAMAVQGSRWGGAGRVRSFGGRAGGGDRNTEREDLQRARWASRREVREQFSHPGGIVIGEMTDPLRETPDFGSKRASWRSRRQGRGRLITMDPAEGNGHVLVIAPSGGYKTSGLVIPNILNYEGPLVVFDPKGDIYPRTKDARREMGYDAVVIDAENGFDPFKMIAPLADQAPSVYYTMAKNLMPLSARPADVSEFYHEMSVSLVAALTAHFIAERKSNIALEIARFVSRDKETVVREGAKIAAKYDLPYIDDEMRGLASLDSRTFPGLVKGIKNKLAFIAFPDMARHATSERSPEEHLQAFGPKTDIFISINSLLAKTFPSFPRTLIGGMFVAAELMEQPDAPSARRLFLIDEARVLGGMDILTNVRDAGRSLGLHLMLIYQSLGQVQEAWGGKAGAEAWLDSCEARVISAVGASGTASDVSTMLGRTTLSVSTTGRSSQSPVFSLMGDSISASKSEQLRDIPLLSQAELGQIPAHGSVIFTRKTKPILATKAVWFTRPDMKHRVREPMEVADELPVNRRRVAVLKALQRYRDAPTDDDGWVGPESPPEEEAPDPDQTDGTPSSGETGPDEGHPVPEDANQPDLFASRSSSPDHADAKGPSADTHDGKGPEEDPVTANGSSEIKEQGVFRSSRGAPSVDEEGGSQSFAADTTTPRGKNCASRSGEGPHPNIVDVPQPAEADPADSEVRPPRPPVAARAAFDVTVHDHAFPWLTSGVDQSVNVDAGAAPATVASAEGSSEGETGFEAEDSEETQRQQGVAAGPEHGDAKGPFETPEAEGGSDPAPPQDADPAPAGPDAAPSTIVPHDGPPRFGVPTEFSLAALEESLRARGPVGKPEPDTAESGAEDDTSGETRPPRSLSAAAAGDPLTAVSSRSPGPKEVGHHTDVEFWGDLGVPASALDFGRRRRADRPQFRALDWSAARLGHIWDRWMGPPGDVPLNLDLLTAERIPHPREASDEPWILRLWDRLNWWLSHPADRYFVYAQKRRAREEDPPLLPTVAGVELWTAPESAPPSHSELRRHISPDTADTVGTGDAYAPSRNSVWISWCLEPAAAADWTPSEIGPLPVDQPSHLIFEHVGAAALEDTSTALPEGDDAVTRWRSSYRSVLAQRALVQTLLASRQPVARSSLVSAFLEAWPQIPRDHAGALYGPCSAVALPLRHWAACLWTEEISGRLRLCRQVLGAGGVPVGAVRTWPIDSEARQWLS